MKRAVLLFILVLVAIEATAQTTIYWKRDSVYAGPGGGAIATITPPPSETTAPTAPSGLGTSGVTATSVYLSWTGSTDSGGSGLAGYKIYRQKGSGASLPVGTVNSSTSAFTDQPLEANTSYTWTIVAFDNAQNHSSASGSANTTTSATSTDTTAPSAPPNVRGFPIRVPSSKVRLDWDGATDAGGSGIAGYKVYRNDTLISGSNPLTARFYEDLTYTANTTYIYKVKTQDGAGNLSGYSNAATVTTFRSGSLDEFNLPNFYDIGGAGEWIIYNNTLQRSFVDPTEGQFVDYVVYGSQLADFSASVKILTATSSSNLYSGFTFWGELGTGPDPEDEDDYCQDNQGLWAQYKGFYRVYETNGTLFLTYWGTCINGPNIYATASSLPTGPGVLKVETTVTAPYTKRIKVYWNGTLKIDYTDTDSSHNHYGVVALTSQQSGSPGSMFDDLLVEY